MSPTLFTVPHQLAPLACGTVFVRFIFYVPSRVPIHCLHLLQRFQPIFLGDMPAWCLNYVPYSSVFLGRIVSCAQCLVGSSKHITILFKGKGDYVEFCTTSIFLMEARLETSCLLDRRVSSQQKSDPLLSHRRQLFPVPSSFLSFMKGLYKS